MRKVSLFFLSLFFISTTINSLNSVNLIKSLSGKIKITNEDIDTLYESLRREIKGISANDDQMVELLDSFDESRSSVQDISMFELKQFFEDQVAKPFSSVGINLTLEEISKNGEKYSIVFKYETTKIQFLKWLTLTPLSLIGTGIHSEVVRATSIIKYFVMLYIMTNYVYPYAYSYIYTFIKKNPSSAFFMLIKYLEMLFLDKMYKEPIRLLNSPIVIISEYFSYWSRLHSSLGWLNWFNPFFS